MNTCFTLCLSHGIFIQYKLKTSEKFRRMED